MQSLRHADEVLFMDEPGYADVPPYLRDKMHYTGIVFRPLDRIDPRDARSALGVPQKATVVMVAPGGSAMHGEERTPVFNLIVQAFDSLPFEVKRLLYVAGGQNHQAALLAASGRTDIVIMKPHDTFTSTIMPATSLLPRETALATRMRSSGRADTLTVSGPQSC